MFVTKTVWATLLAVAVGFRATFLAVGILLLLLTIVVARGVPADVQRRRA